MRRHWLLALALALALALGLGAGAWYWNARVRRAHAEAPVPDLTRPASDRIRVEVLNATRVRGLARQATFYLRDRGFDVVSIGTNSDQRDSTVVLDRTNHPDWARRLAQAMGGARVEARPDSTLYVDLTVLVGRAWRPPAQPLHP
jgi:hypothetical protein